MSHPRILAPTYLCRKLRQGAKRGRFEAAALFVDVSGFTALTETLLRHGRPGAEVLSDILDDLFQPLVRTIYRRGGFVATFAGDAITAVFPFRRRAARAHALAAAAEIRRLFGERADTETEYGKFRQDVTVGVADGEVEWGFLGQTDHLAYFLRGSAIEGAARAATHARRGEILSFDTLVRRFGGQVEAAPTAGERDLVALGAIALDPPTRRRPRPESHADVIRRFCPSAVLELRDRGEFRAVCPVFVSFEEVRSLRRLDTFVTCILELCVAYGAYFNKIDFGDKGGVVLVLLGAPVGYENNAARACDLLLDLRSADVGIRWRAGITHGTVYAGFLGGAERSEYTAIGDVVNVAARLMTAADWGQILATEGAAREAGDRHRWDHLGPRALKGRAAPARVLSLVGRARGGSQRRFEGEFRGRDAELGTMLAFASPLARGEFAGVLHVLGEAGVGKSRLAHEFGTRLPNRVSVLSCPAEGLVRRPLGPFLRFLRRRLGVLDDLAIAESRLHFDREWAEVVASLRRLPATAATGRILEELERTASVLAALLGVPIEGGLWDRLDAQGRHENSLLALRAFFAAESLRGPTVVLVEDGHLIDAESREFLGVLTRGGAGLPMLVLVTSRLHDDGSTPDLGLDEKVRRLDVSLRLLSSDQLRVLATTELGGETSIRLIEFLQARTQGNPLFLLQLLSFLREKRMLEQRAGTWELAAEAVEIPETIEALLLARLDRLPADTREAVKAASVMGQTFEIELLSDLLDRTATSVLASGERNRIWAAVGELEYAFKHAMLRDVAYDMQLRSRLRTLHAKVAASLEARYGDVVEDRLADLAYHFERAGKIGKALPYLLGAGNAANRRFQNARAIELYDRLLALAGGSESWRALRHDAALEKASVLTHVGRAREAVEILHPVRREAEAAEDVSRRSQACLELGSALEELGEYETAVTYYEESLTLCLSVGDRRGYASARGNLGECYRLQGRLDDALTAYREARRIDEEIGHGEGVQRDVNNIAIIHAMRDEDDAALAGFLEGFEVAEASDDPLGVARALCNLGIMHRRQSRHDEALDAYERALDLAEELGNRRLQAMITGNLGNLFGAREEWHRAASNHERAIETSVEIGDQLGIARSTGNLALALGRLGRHDRADALFEEALERAAQLGADDLRVAHLHEHASLLHRRGDLTPAIARNAEAAALAGALRYARYDDAISELARALEEEVRRAGPKDAPQTDR